MKRLEQERIAQAKLEWEITVDALPQLVCMLNEQGRIVRANRVVESWGLGSVSTVKGKCLHDLLHHDCHNPRCSVSHMLAQMADEMAMGSGIVWDSDEAIPGRTLRIRLRPMPSSGRQGRGPQQGSMILVIDDITKRKLAEDIQRDVQSVLERQVSERTAELEKSNARLRSSESELRLLSAQLIAAQENERKRIASELHDGISQTLSAIKFYLENTAALCRSGESVFGVEAIDNIVPRVQSAIDEVRRISMALRPSTLDDLGILATLGWFAREFRSIYDTMQLDMLVSADEGDVPAPIKTPIYRIVQEALNNIVKHSKAGRIEIQLDATGDDIVLMITDNGVGFDVTAVATRENRCGIGLSSMRERAEVTGGQFSCTSSRERGTAIRVTWPRISRATADT